MDPRTGLREARMRRWRLAAGRANLKRRGTILLGKAWFDFRPGEKLLRAFAGSADCITSGVVARLLSVSSGLNNIAGVWRIVVRNVP